MIRLVRVGLSPNPADPALAGLRGQTLYHPSPEHPSFARLREAGFNVEEASDVVPEGAVLLVPEALRTGPVDELAAICDRLLGPGGCPWDQAQTHESLKKHLIEEAYEVLDAIDAGEDDAFAEELGDLLLQPVLHAAMAKRDQRFDLDDVAGSINAKLIRRHPHVFGDLSVADADEVLRNWDAIKKAEKGTSVDRSVLEGVPRSLPALQRALEVSKRAARAGFEWPDLEGVWDKLAEEVSELKEALSHQDQEASEAELGDLLFTVVNVARWNKIEPEEALRRMVDRFTQRFQTMESIADRPLAELSPEEWDALWTQAKSLK